MNGDFRRTQDPFTMVNNTVIEDKNLSMKAKGLYLIIKHYITIPNFTLNKSYLMSLSKEGERAFESGWKELKDAGYLIQYRLKGEDGKWVYEYELLHTPRKVEKAIAKPKGKTDGSKVSSYNKKVKMKKAPTDATVEAGKTDNNTVQNRNNSKDNISHSKKKDNGKNCKKVKSNSFNNGTNNNFANYEENELSGMLEDSQVDKFSSTDRIKEALYERAINDWDSLRDHEKERVLLYASEREYFIPPDWDKLGK